MVEFFTQEDRYRVSKWGLWRGEEKIKEATELCGGDSIQMKVDFLNLKIDKECVLGIRIFFANKQIGLLAREVTIFPDVMPFSLVSPALVIPDGAKVDRVELYLEKDFAWVSPEEEKLFLIGKNVAGVAKASLSPNKCGFEIAVEHVSDSPSEYIGNYNPAKELFRGTVCFVQDGKALWIQDQKYYAKEPVIRKNNTLHIPVTTVKLLFGNELQHNDYISASELAKQLGAYYYEDRFGLGVISELPYDYSESCYLKRIQLMVRLLAFQRPKAVELRQKYIRKDRPRSLGTRMEIERMLRLADTDPDAAFLSEELLKQAERSLKLPIQTVLDREKKYACFATAIVDFDELLPLYWAWLKTGDEKYLKCFKSHILAMARMDHWYGDCFYLMTSRALVGLAMAYDFLYNEFTSDERKEIAYAMVHNGFLPAMELYYGRADEACWPWCIRKTNWNFISNSGIIFAACTIFDEYETEICADVLEKAIQSLEYAMIYLAPNGELFEGPGYASYSWTYIVFALNALESHFGTAFSLDCAPGAKQSYMVPFRQMSATGIFAQGDGPYCTMNLGLSYTLWWAKRLHDHGIQHQRQRQHIPGGSRVCFTDLLWFDDKPEPTTWSLDFISECTQTAISRSDWSDTAAVIGIHAGDNTLEHGHADLGSFDFEINGFRFAREMGLDGEIYCAPGSKYMFKERDEYYIARAEGHNVYVINPDRSRGQQSIGKSEVQLLACTSDNVRYMVDMEPAYRGQVKAARRYVELKDRRRVFVVEDEIEPLKPGDKVFWFWHTHAKISFSDPKAVEMQNEKTVILKTGSKKLRIKLECSIPFTVRKGMSLPLESSPAPFDQLQTDNIICKLLTVIFETGNDTVRFKATAWEEE